jgi:uncharacterized protein YjbI with pentapeptide repeats
MPNPEHLKILEQGVEPWNEWRKEHREIRPDLSYAELFNADLRLINLNNVNLSNAELINAILNHADLSYANLRKADLFNADLRSVNLRNADLSYTDLTLANLTRSNLTGANVTNSIFGLTILSDIDLSKIKGLKNVIHTDPSTISIDTIYKSGGKLPEKFLRECGVPEDLITYMHSLTGKAIEFYSCFISYSSKDEEFARRLYADLQNEGVRCWFAPEDLKIGDRFRVRIDESIRLYDKLLLVLSESSVASGWVEKEVETAFEKEREQGKIMLFPVRLDDAVLDAKTGWAADVRRSRHIGDFRDWKNHDSYRKAFERLMRDLKAEASR